jgi:hypothetical protein
VVAAWLLFPFKPSPVTTLRLRGNHRPDAVVGELRRNIGLRAGWRSVLGGRAMIVGQFGEGWFRLRFAWVTRNPYRPSLDGRLVASELGTEATVTIDRPQIWVAKILRVGMITILPIIFLVGLVGMITGGHTDQGGSLLPFVLIPLGIGAGDLALEAALRREGQSQERRLVQVVTDALQ